MNTIPFVFSEMMSPSDRSEIFEALKCSYDQNELLDLGNAFFRERNKTKASHN